MEGKVPFSPINTLEVDGGVMLLAQDDRKILQEQSVKLITAVPDTYLLADASRQISPVTRSKDSSCELQKSISVLRSAGYIDIEGLLPSSLLIHHEGKRTLIHRRISRRWSEDLKMCLAETSGSGTEEEDGVGDIATKEKDGITSGFNLHILYRVRELVLHIWNELVIAWTLGWNGVEPCYDARAGL